MKIVIEYCVSCGYEKRATGLAAAIKRAIPDSEIELLGGSGGAFEVVRDGTSVFSKKALGRFPTDGEVIDAL